MTIAHEEPCLNSSFAAHPLTKRLTVFNSNDALVNELFYDTSFRVSMCDIKLNESGRVVKNDTKPRKYWDNFSNSLSLPTPDYVRMFAMLTMLRGYLYPYLPVSDLGYIGDTLSETSVKEHLESTGDEHRRIHTPHRFCCVCPTSPQFFQHALKVCIAML
jgi:hypothetical protein